MKKTLLASLVCVVALAGCNQKEETEAPAQSQQEANPICNLEKLPGGWSQSDMTDEAQPLLDVVLAQMNTSAKLKQILSVRTQVVSGMNYAIEFEMAPDWSHFYSRCSVQPITFIRTKPWRY